MVMKVNRSLYVLSQSPALWYDTIDEALLGIRFTPTSSDRCVYTTYGSYDTCENSDDVLISGSNLGVVHRLKKALMDCFPMANTDEVSLILGMSKNYTKRACRPFCVRLHPEHSGKVWDAGLQLRSHTMIWTRTICGTVGR